ncbi:MAG: FtsQ-type POTRA domain-containing protein [Proteobacteria bacterium]|nr:FtsQ-type POTRA domain-containing protein [Pseudomonadota bacterium]MBU1640836.1 FtsQ-type POTRA domain-containing protein [Pseudomonadota bacterium]
MKKRNSAYSSSLQKRMKAERAESRHLYAIFVGVALAIGVMALTGWGIYAGLCHSVFFQVESITVEGSKRLNADEIAALAGLENKSNLIAVSKKKIEASLKATGWIRKVDVDKKWPNSIALVIHERIPTAMIHLDGVLSYIDSNGHIFAPVLVGEDLDYPVLFVPSSEILTDIRALKGPLEMLRYASHGDPDLPKQNISQLVLDEQGGLTMYLADNPFPVILGKDKMWTKYKRLTKVLAWLYKKKKFSTVASIDMEYLEGRVLVKFNG